MLWLSMSSIKFTNLHLFKFYSITGWFIKKDCLSIDQLLVHTITIIFFNAVDKHLCTSQLVTLNMNPKLMTPSISAKKCQLLGNDSRICNVG